MERCQRLGSRRRRDDLAPPGPNEISASPRQRAEPALRVRRRPRSQSARRRPRNPPGAGCRGACQGGTRATVAVLEAPSGHACSASGPGSRRARSVRPADSVSRQGIAPESGARQGKAGKRNLAHCAPQRRGCHRPSWQVGQHLARGTPPDSPVQPGAG
jgi:hypothetical protein